MPVISIAYKFRNYIFAGVIPCQLYNKIQSPVLFCRSLRFHVSNFWEFHGIKGRARKPPYEMAAEAAYWHALYPASIYPSFAVSLSFALLYRSRDELLPWASVSLPHPVHLCVNHCGGLNAPLPAPPLPCPAQPLYWCCAHVARAPPIPCRPPCFSCGELCSTYFFRKVFNTVCLFNLPFSCSL